MPLMSQVQVPFLTLQPQASGPSAAPSGTLLLWLNSVDHQLYVTDSSGTAVSLVSQEVAPLCNSNDVSPLILNAHGGPVTTRRH